MSHPFLRGIGRYLKKMERLARERGAPVFRAEEVSARTPFDILVYTLLSARTRDEATTEAFIRLSRVVKGPEDLLRLGPKRIEKIIKGVGFHRTKAKHLYALAKVLKGRKVPDTLEGLTALPGVGIKTASIVLARAFGKAVIGVDTHVHRIANRLGLVRTKTPEETSRILNRIVPPKYRKDINRIFVAFGQTVCRPQKPLCEECPLRNVCAHASKK